MITEKQLEQIRKGKIWRFHGGIHPDGRKSSTAGSPIRLLPLPNILIVPLKQSTAAPAELLVKEGDHVLRGQMLTRAVAPNQFPVHAPTSGTVKAIGYARACHPSGLSDLAVTIIPDGEDEWLLHKGCADYRQKTPEELAQIVSEAGVAGMGGAGFPAGRKLKFALGKIAVLIINGCECEPYLTADDALMREKSGEIAEGIGILQHILKPQITLLAIEDNKPEAIRSMREAISASGADITVRALPTLYPTGAARPLIYTLTGIEVGYDSRSNDFGITMHNVASVYAIKRAVVDGEPNTERVVTVTGRNFKTGGNYLLRNGTLLKHLINHLGLNNQTAFEMIIGGPMMGFSAAGMDTPLTRTSGCVIAPDENELPMGRRYLNCIKCGRCQNACPSRLVPYMLLSHARAGNFEGLEDCHFKDCIQCGCCTYVCSSRIPLVMEFRKALAEIRRLKNEEREKAASQELVAARNARLEQEAAERQARIEAMKARNAKASENKPASGPDANANANGSNQDSAVEATTAKPASGGSAAMTPAEKAKAIALARAKAAAAAKTSGAKADSGTQTPPASPVKTGNEAMTPAEKAKAIALAKAKAATAAKASGADSGSQTQPSAPEKAGDAAMSPAEKAKAIALAKAKAIAAAKSAGAGAKADSGSPTQPSAPEKACDAAMTPAEKAKAIALAKAKAIAAAKSAGAGAKADSGSPTQPSAPEKACDAAMTPAEKAKAIALAKAREIAKARAQEQNKKEGS